MRLLTLSILATILLLFSCKNNESTNTQSADSPAIHEDIDTSLTRNITRSDGPYSEKNDKGVIVEKGEFKNGLQEGKRFLYFDNGAVKAEENYVKGNFEGPFKEFFENGKLFQQGQYVNNAMTGIWKTYYDTGELKEEVTFVENNENGPFKEYHKNGKVKYEGSYKDGDNEDGEMKVFNEDGELVKKLDCKKGKCTTIWVKKGYEDVKR
jgi:antitoxin component YwqK of YwqJK toxin-antitoxin module